MENTIEEAAEDHHLDPTQNVSQAQNDTALGSKHTSSGWIKGFIQIIIQPQELDALRGANVYKIYILASLILSFSFTLSSWFTWLHPQLREQALYCLNYIPLSMGQTPLPAAQSFQFTQILATTLIQQGLVGLVVMALVMWVIHRVFTNEPLRILAILGICSYAAVITGIGYILTSLLQLATVSVNSGFSISAFLQFQDYPFLSGYLSKFDLFMAWQYVATGVAVSSFMGRSRTTGLGFALIAFITHAAFSGMLTYYSFQLLLQAKH